MKSHILDENVGMLLSGTTYHVSASTVIPIESSTVIPERTTSAGECNVVIDAV